MSFVRYNDREDMQDDSYKLAADLLRQITDSYYTNDIEAYFKGIDSLFILVHHRMLTDRRNDGKTLVDDIEKKLKAASEVIYARSRSDIDGLEEMTQDMTETMDDLREVLKQLVRMLDDIGILFKIRVDANSIVTRTGRS